MKIFYRLCCIAAVLMAAVACEVVEEENNLPVGGFDKTEKGVFCHFTPIEFDGPATKGVDLSADDKVTFDEKDKINIWSDSKTALFYTLTDINGNYASAFFDGGGFKLTNDLRYTSLYPAMATLEFDAVPMTYTGQVQSTSGSSSHIKNYLYYWAEAYCISGHTEFDFTTRSGFIKFTLTFPLTGSEEATIKTVKLVADSNVFATAPTLNAGTGEITNGGLTNEISVALGESGFHVNASNPTIVVYMAVAPFESSVVSVKAIDSESNVYTSSSFTTSVNAGKIKPLTCPNMAIAAANKVYSDVDHNQTVYNYDQDLNDLYVTIVYEPLGTSEDTQTALYLNATSGTYPKNVYITVDSECDLSETTLNINMPNSHVVLSAAENETIGNIVSTTSLNTLVIGEKIAVGTKLTVSGGGLTVDGTVGEIAVAKNTAASQDEPDKIWVKINETATVTTATVGETNCNLYIAGTVTNVTTAATQNTVEGTVGTIAVAENTAVSQNEPDMIWVSINENATVTTANVGETNCNLYIAGNVGTVTTSAAQTTVDGNIATALTANASAEVVVTSSATVNAGATITANDFSNIYLTVGSTTSGTTQTDIVNQDANTEENNTGRITVDVHPEASVDGVEYMTFAKALAMVPTNGVKTTVKLLTDVALAEGFTVKATQNMVLDLNGFTLSEVLSQSGTSALITNDGTLVIQDKTDASANGSGTGKITYNNGNPDQASVPGYASNTIINQGNLTINSGYIENTTTGGYAAYTVDNITNGGSYTPTFTMNGGKLYNNYTDAVRMFLNSETNLNKVVINGGILDSDKASGRVVVMHDPGAKAGMGELIITGGTIMGMVNAWSAAHAGGVEDRFGDGQYEAINIEISGGSIENLDFSSMANTTLRASSLSVTGGTYKIDPSDYVSAGYRVVASGDANFPFKVELTPAAKIGTTEYATLAEAFKAVGEGQTITILTDIDFSQPDYSGYKWAGSVYNPLELCANGVTIDLDGHTFSNMGNCAIAIGHLLAKDGRISNLTIKNGTMLAGKTDNVTNSYVLIIAGVENMTIKDITTNGGINVCSGSTGVVIEGCTINGTKYYTVCAQTGSQVTIKGTTYTKNTDATVANKSMFWIQGASTDSDMVTSTNPTGAFGASSITIEGGTYTVDFTNGGVFYLTSGVAPSLKGGTYNFNANAYCAPGYEAVEENSLWTVRKANEALIGETEYATLAAAFAAVQDGETITVRTNIDLPATIAVTKQVTLDLNGKTISNTADLWVGNNWSFFSVKASGNLTVTGNGTIDAKANDCYTFDVQDGGTLTIENGTFTGNISCVYLINQANTGVSTCNIEGGTFSIKQLASNVTEDKYRFLLNCLDASYQNNAARFNVTGGSFVNFNPANNLAEGAATNFCAAGYTATQTGDVWTVSQAKVAQVNGVEYATLAEAIVAVPTTGAATTITLVSDVTLDTQNPISIPSNKNVVLDLNGHTITHTAPNAASAATITNHGTLTIDDSIGGGSISMTATPDANWAYGIYVIDNRNALVINNGTIRNDSARGLGFAVHTGAWGVSTNVEVHGGTISHPNYCAFCIYYQQSGKQTVSIDGGTFIGDASPIWYQICTDHPDIDMTISGGVVNSTSDKYAPFYVWAYDPGFDATNVKMSITGGTITSSCSDGGIIDWDDAESAFVNLNKKVISGGVFNVQPGSEEIVDGYESVEVANGWTVQKIAGVAKIGNTPYTTLAAALAAATSGQTVTLLSNVETTAQFEVDKEMTLDLNGKTIQYTGTSTLPSGVIMVLRGANLTITDSGSNGSILGGEMAYAAVALTKNGETSTAAAQLTVNGGTLRGHYYAIVGNGNRQGTVITVNGGTLVGEEGSAIFHPQAGTLTITGGSLSGAETGVELRSGTLNISGGTFTATAEEYSCSPNGSGSTTTGAALAIAQHTTNQAITANITGGTFVGTKKLSIANPQDNAFNNVTVSGLNTLFGDSVVVPDGYIWSNNGDGTSSLFKPVTTWDGSSKEALTVVDADTYAIYSAAQLAQFAYNVNNGTNYAGKTVVLMNDIDLNNQAWTPIGNTVANWNVAGTGFAGTFDGNEKTVSNLAVSELNGGSSFAGFFGIVNPSKGNTVTIKDLAIDNFTVASNHQAGAIVGHSGVDGGVGKIVITGCSVSNGTLTSTPTQLTNGYDDANQVGAIAGALYNGAHEVTSNNVSTVTINGFRDLGGLVGFMTAGTMSGNTVTGATINQVDAGYTVDEWKKTQTVNEFVGRRSTSESTCNTAWELGEGNTFAGTINRLVSGVAKIGNTGYSSLAAAVAAAQSGDTIELIADDDISLTNGGEIEINKPLTITGAVDSEGVPMYTVYGTPTFTGQYNDVFLNSTDGTISISNILFSHFSDEVTTSKNGRAVLLIGSHNNNAVIDNVYIDNINTEAIHINGGSFLIKDCAFDCANLNDGVFTRGIQVTNSAHGTITHTDISNTVAREDLDAPFDTAPIELIGSGTILIEDCTLSALDETNEKSAGIVVTSAANSAGSSQVTIRNCSISAYLALCGDGDYGAQITVESGEYAGYLVQGDNGTGLTLTGGLYEVDPSDFIPNGYKVYTLSGGLYDGWYLVFEDNGGYPIATTYGADVAEELGAW